ncbi:RDD family protein [Eionea flava]
MNTATSSSIQYAPVWRRFTAIIYDALLIAAISMGYGAIGVGLTHWLNGDDAVEINNHLHWLFQMGWLMVVIGFFCFFWRRAGQTLGMRAWRLKIVREGTQNTASVPQCIGRCVLAPFCLPLFFIGWLRNDQQCLHDLATGTQVVLLPKGS